jgi:uncharacterized protein (TIGR03086 family)
MTAAGIPVVDLLQRTTAAFDAVVRQVKADQWHDPTPCTDWDVRALLNHVAAEDRWITPLLSGRTIADFGGALDGDLLGADPLRSWTEAREEADSALGADGVVDRTVQLSFGPTSSAEYLNQLAADHLIHAWDLATAIGADATLDAELVEAVGSWFREHEHEYRSAGATAPRPPVGHDADPQTRLLAMFGRPAAPLDAEAVVDLFNTAFAARDIDAVMRMMTPECVFESTTPPDGERYVGQKDVRRAWTEFFAASSSATFRTEDVVACGNQVVARWRYDWAGESPGHVRGVDVFRIHDGLIEEKASYVKG